MKKEIDIGTHIRNELAQLEVSDSKISEIVKIIEREDEPKQPAPEPVRLWCAKDYEPGKWVTRGNVYEVKGKRAVSFDDGWCDKSFYPMMLESGFIDDNGTRWDKYLFPLLHRPAKEGEWVRNATTGDVVNVIAVSRFNNGLVYVRSKYHNAELIGDASDKSIEPPFDYWSLHEYDVIENYHGEYEPCPKCGKMGEK